MGYRQSSVQVPFTNGTDFFWSSLHGQTGISLTLQSVHYVFMTSVQIIFLYNTYKQHGRKTNSELVNTCNYEFVCTEDERQGLRTLGRAWLSLLFLARAYKRYKQWSPGAAAAWSGFSGLWCKLRTPKNHTHRMLQPWVIKYFSFEQSQSRIRKINSVLTQYQKSANCNSFVHIFSLREINFSLL